MCINDALKFMMSHNIRFIERLGDPSNSFNGVTFYRGTDGEVMRDFLVTTDDGFSKTITLDERQMKSCCF